MIEIQRKKCVIYSRVSSQGQVDGGGLGSQESSCKRYAHTNGYEVIETFQEEGVLGGLKERPMINKLFAFVKKYNQKHTEKIEIFLADNVDRIARSYEVHLDLKRMMFTVGMTLETVNQKIEDTPNGKFIEGIMALSAELYREENRTRVIARQEARLLDGYRPRDYPIGYKTTQAPNGGRLLIIEPTEAPLIKEALEGYANGLFQTQGEIAEFFERKGLEFKKRKKSRKNGDMKKVHVSSVSRMLKNILYAGYIKYHKTTKDKYGTIKKAWNIPLREAKHEGIISIETYNKIQEKMNSKHQPTKGGVKMVNERFPLRGYLFCSCCEHPLSSGESRGNGGKVAYYTFNKKCQLKNKSLNADKVHKEFEEHLKKLTPDKKFLTFLKLILIQERKERQKDFSLDKNAIKKQMEKIDEQMESFLDLVINATSEVVRKKYETRIEQLEVDKQTLIASMEKKKDIGFPKLIDIAFEILINPYEIRNKGTIEQKRLFLNIGFRKKILVQKNDVTI